MAAPTTIGSTIKIRGEFESAEDISVLGNISGRIETTADVFVEEGGVIGAEIVTRNIDVHGTVIGNITASDRFQVHDGGNVTGDVKAPRVILADGAKYKGNIDMTEAGRRAPSPAAAPVGSLPPLRRK
jgi:cytoskeletal protein CcmA (bactofilin family)